MTANLLTLALVTTFAAASIASAGAECRLAEMSRLPLTTSRDGFLVPVMLDGQPASLLFDTGSFTSVLNLSAADRLGLPHMHDEEKQGMMGVIRGVGGGKTAMAVTARSVNIGGLTGRDYNFLAADVVPPPADGLLSIDLISQFDVDLDLPEYQVVLYKPLGDCSSPSAFLASPLYAVPLRPNGQDRRPRINVTIGGHGVVALIDTGATRSAIFRRAAERLGLDMAALTSDARVHANGVGPRTVEGVSHVFAPVSVGDLTFDHMRVDILDEHGDDEVEMLLGADFQRAVHLWISYSSKSLIIQYPPRPSKKK